LNPRQRMLKTLLFQKPDKIPLVPGEGRRSTIARWHKEGLPKGVKDITAFAYQICGGKEVLSPAVEEITVNFKMNPEFEEKVIEEFETTQVVQDWKGNICEIGKQFSPEYLREPMDFVTRRWIKCPVESRNDWKSMEGRYNPNDRSRIAGEVSKNGHELKNRDSYVAVKGIPGPFWQLREWLGFENLCIMFHDNPSFLMEMINFWENFVYRLLQNLFDVCVPDEVHFSEDMAFKNHSMISPAMVRRFLLPTYNRWGTLAKDAGCSVFSIDSDGFIGELLPIWIETGINVCDPVEVAANNDVVYYRKRFGSRMAYRGGVDKRAIAKGGPILEAELLRLGPVIRTGGYLPGCDHGIPSDVSWDNFLFYVCNLAHVCGWL
jgi:hypothetical protein